jgi:hypothetical protein
MTGAQSDTPLSYPEKEHVPIIPSMSNNRSINHAHNYSRSEPLLAGTVDEITSSNYLTNLEDYHIHDHSLDDWNRYGIRIRRPASTGVIGRNSKQNEPYSNLTPSVQRESLELQKINNLGYDVENHAFSLQTSQLFNGQLSHRPDTMLGTTIFGFDDRNALKDTTVVETHVETVQQRIPLKSSYDVRVRFSIYSYDRLQTNQR